MKYVIIMPAYNEERFIINALETVVAQTLQPQLLLVVNDGSTDGTAAVVDGFARRYPWIKQIINERKELRAAGGKVVRAFYLGYNALPDHNYDFLVKLDADLTLPQDYFEKVAAMFAADEKLGIAGGTIVIEQNGQWVYEHFSDEDHVKGAFKAYRKACFDSIGGLKESIGWDTADELLARYHGWHIKVDTRLQIKHYRVLGAETGSVKIRQRVGQGMYRLRYGFWITLISAIKAGYLNKPYILTGIAVMTGFIKSWWAHDAFMVSEAEGRFIRKFRWGRMGKKIGL